MHWELEDEDGVISLIQKHLKKSPKFNILETEIVDGLYAREHEKYPLLMKESIKKLLKKEKNKRQKLLKEIERIKARQMLDQ